MPWNQKQGPGYCKQMAQDKKKAAKDKDGQFSAMMQEKAEALKKLIENLDTMKSNANAKAAAAASEVTLEQLWADSLIPPHATHVRGCER